MTQSRGRWRRWKAVATAGLAGAILLGCPGSKANDPSPSPPGAPTPSDRPVAPPIPVEVRSVEIRNVTYTLQAVGSVEAREIIRVPARVAGVVQDLAFQEGKAVTPRDVLARIDPERYRLSAQRAEANYRQAEAQAREAEAALEKRKALHEKDPGWVTEEELTNFTAQVDQAQAAVAAAKAAADLARKDLADSEVRTEAPGIINQKLVDTGQYLTAGTPVATMVDTRRLKLSFKVAQSEASRMAEDSRISFRVRSGPEKEFTAKLYHTGEAADPATRMVECLAWVENPNRDLRPGFFADVTIDVGEKKGSLVVPQTAVLPTDRGFVGFVLKGEDRVEQRPLRLGLYTKDGDVEVLEGLRPGDRVVIRGASVLSEGSRVQAETGGKGK